MNKKEENSVNLMLKDINPKIHDKLKDYYFDLIVPRGLNHIDRINIIAGPIIKRNKSNQIIEKIENENFKDLNFLIYLANENPQKISFFLRNQNTQAYPFNFISHNNNYGACIIYDNNSEESAGTLVFNNPPLVKKLNNIFDTELMKTRKIDFSSVSNKKEILKRMNLEI